VAEPPGYRPDPNGIPRIQVQFRLAEDEPGPGLIEAIAPDLQKVYLHPEVLITNADITETHVAPSETAEHPVLIVLRPEARTKVKVATRNHTGKPLVILFNGTVYKIANVNGPFSSPIELSGRYSQQEAEQIARGLVGGG
jgi:preprotein translocase subunit SecD